MINKITSYIRNNQNEFLFFIFLFLFHMAYFNYYLLMRNNYVISSDELSRNIKSLMFTYFPRLIYDGVWPPFQFYIEGFFLFFYKNLLWLPRIILVIFSFFSSINIYYIFKKITHNSIIPIIANILILTNISYLKYSYHPFSEIYNIFFVSGAILFFNNYLQTKKNKDLYTSSIFCFLSSGFRFDGWFFVAFYCAYLFVYAVIFNRKNKKETTKLIICSAIPALFPLSWLIISYLKTGNFLNSVSLRQQYYHHDNTDFFSGLFFYFTKFFTLENFRPYTMLFIGTISLSIIHLKEKLIYFIKTYNFMLLSLFFSFLVLSFYNAFSTPPSIYDRILLQYFVFIVPTCLYFIYLLISMPSNQSLKDILSFLVLFIFYILIIRKTNSLNHILLSFIVIVPLFLLFRKNSNLKNIKVTILLLLFSALIFNNISLWKDDADKRYNQFIILGQKALDAQKKLFNFERKILIPYRPWWYRGIVIGYSDYNSIIFDSEPYNPLISYGVRMTPVRENGKYSIFDQDFNQLSAFLKKNKIGIVICPGTEIYNKIKRLSIYKDTFFKTNDWYIVILE